MTMKASMHSGRNGSAKHNDRSFLAGKTSKEQTELAPHIDLDMTDQNQVHQVREASGPTLEEAELGLYKRLFQKAVEATNSRYRAQGHPERCKTIEDVYRGRQTRPEETIYQIGNAERAASPEDLHKCYKDFKKHMLKWNREHGCPLAILNYSLHVDETTPHIHERRVWSYTDKDGNRRIGQNRALEAAGIPLPYPDKPMGRFNNRKMTFDKLARQMWIDTCREHGFEIDSVPDRGVRHRDKQAYMAGKIADLQNKLNKYETLERKHPEDFKRLRQLDRRNTRFER